MWFKLDDGFVTHPKILKAGPLALALQVRAISYASHHKTDGYLPLEAIPLLIPDLGRSVEEWATCMMEHRLWDRQAPGYCVHDYLDWNLSKRELKQMQKQKSLAGQKGMKARWGKRSRRITPVITDAITPVNNTLVLSSSILNSLNSPNPEWFECLKKNPIYAHIDFVRERGKMDVWQSKPMNRHRKLTQKFVINWLNNIEPPLTNNGGRHVAEIPPFPGPDDPIGRGRWRQTYGDPASPKVRQ